MGMGRPTLADVAAEAGVSRSTASAALRGDSVVAERTQQAVREAARRIGYRTNLAASSLRSGRQQLIALVLDPAAVAGGPLSPYVFWAAAISELAKELAELNIRLVSGTLEDLFALNEMPIDGVVIATSGEPTLPPELPHNLPVLVFDEQVKDSRIKVRVWRDYHSVVGEGLDHLAEQGATRLGHLQHITSLRYVEQFAVAVESWVAQRGMEYVIIPHEGSNESIYEAVRSAVAGGVDALFSTVGQVRTVIDAIAAEGRRCPDDVLFLNHGIGWLEVLPSTGVSSLSMEPHESARLVAEAIVRMLAEPGKFDLQLPCSITVRDSTDRSMVSR